jgi:alkanesulfonate monooxygenase SsuD/methylene tetrahydromethanopterin reductase-like flavin-dependent oxidoreductase (luciferase family)
MKYGIFDHLDHAGGSLGELFAMRLDLIEAYDRAGFHGYHLAEHHGTELGAAPSPGIFLAAASQRSAHLRLGAMVFCLPLYQPIRLLEEICMLDQMSGGRLDLGVGRGVSPIEVGFFGHDPAATPAIYRESLELILAGLKGGELNFEGEYYAVRDMPMVLYPRQQPHPPLWVGIGHPDSAEWPAQNDINIICNLPAGKVRAVTDRYREIRAASNKKNDEPLMGITRHIIVADNRNEAREIGRRAYLPWRTAFMKLWDRHGIPLPNFTLPENFDTFRAAGQAFAGTPDELKDFVAEQISESGVNYFLCRFAFGDISFHEAKRSAELFHASIMARY